MVFPESAGTFADGDLRSLSKTRCRAINREPEFHLPVYGGVQIGFRAREMKFPTRQKSRLFFTM